ncbi:MAG TPA: hypothetical protein VEB21_15045 [Terriglobales bacterium]|nr:hypothetical protein [Terriglobales bacterium]
MKFVASIVALLLVAGVAPAQVQTKEQQKCVNALNGGASKVAAQQGKADLSCLKDAAEASLAGSAESCLVGDGKVAAKIDKLHAAEIKKCVAPPSFGYSDAATSGGAARSGRLLAFHDLFGADLDSGALSCAGDEAGCDCQRQVAKAADKLANAKWKIFLKCKKAALKAGASSAEDLQKCISDAATEGSLAADSKGAIAKSRAKLGELIGRDCDEVSATAAAFGNGECSSLSGDSLASCIDDRTDCRLCQTFNDADALTVDCDLFDDDSANGSCIDTTCFDGTVCSQSCIPSVDEPPAAVVGPSTVCAESCQARTNLTVECGACSQLCGVAESCVGGECRCQSGGAVCITPFPTTPQCVFDERSTCEFLQPDGASGNPPYHYTLLQVTGYQDTPIYFRIAFDGLVALPGGYTPYVAACDGSRGVFKVPGDRLQADHIDNQGRITNLALLDSNTGRDPACVDPNFVPLTKSINVGSKGYYIKFTPAPGESGDNYNYMTLIADTDEPNTETFEIIHVIIDILPAG